MARYGRFLAKGVINYAVQFPGPGSPGDYLPPAADVSADRVPGDVYRNGSEAIAILLSIRCAHFFWRIWRLFSPRF